MNIIENARELFGEMIDSSKEVEDAKRRSVEKEKLYDKEVYDMLDDILYHVSNDDYEEEYLHKSILEAMNKLKSGFKVF